MEKILKIHNTCFENKNVDQIVKYSKLFRNIFYIYELNGEIIGYSGFYLHLKFIGLKRVQVATLFSIAIDNAYQEKGYGSQLLKESIKDLQKNKISCINLYVNVKNFKSFDFYKTNGFKIIDELKDICGKGEKCYKMNLNLIEEVIL
jgi:ribosomal-protein-alanine N-acetyltransferase